MAWWQLVAMGANRLNEARRITKFLVWVSVCNMTKVTCRGAYFDKQLLSIACWSILFSLFEEIVC